MTGIHREQDNPPPTPAKSPGLSEYCQGISCISKTQAGMELRIKSLRRVTGKISNRVYCASSVKFKEEKLLPHTCITLSRFCFYSDVTRALGPESFQ